MANLAELLDRAVNHHRGGTLSEAEAIYRQILAADVAHATAHHLLGLLAQQTGRNEMADMHLRQAIDLDPRVAAFHVSLGNFLFAQRQVEAASTCFRRALEHHPRHAGILNNLGVALKDLGQIAEAISCFRQALACSSQYVDALDNLAAALHTQKNLVEAAECSRQALRLQPTHPQAHNTFGTILQDQGKLIEAMECYREALRIDPKNVQAHYNLGTAHLRQRQFTDAVSCFRKALYLRPSYDKAHINLGNAFKEQGQLTEAAQCFRSALAIDPGNPDALTNLGNVLVAQGLIDAGAEKFRQALHVDPAHVLTRWNRCLLHLSQENYTDAWSDYELRWDLPDWPPHSFRGPRWDGSTLEGKTILVFSEQGIGDTIQFVRYLPLVKARGGHVLLSCPRALHALLADVAGVDQLIAMDAPAPAYDVQIPLLSLPGIFQTSAPTIPAPLPYLRVDKQRVDHWRVELAGLAETAAPAHGVEGPRLTVGILWQGNPKVAWDALRSIPLANFQPLANVPGVRLMSLQRGPGTSQLPPVARRIPIVDLGPRLETFSDTAAVMMNIDLIVTSDNFAAHLAGALGVPVWTALHLVPDWRWQLERVDSPWYSTMRLFRQRRLGEWRDVFERIAAELRRRTTG